MTTNIKKITDVFKKKYIDTHPTPLMNGFSVFLYERRQGYAFYTHRPSINEVILYSEDERVMSNTIFQTYNVSNAKKRYKLFVVSESESESDEEDMVNSIDSDDENIQPISYKDIQGFPEEDKELAEEEKLAEEKEYEKNRIAEEKQIAKDAKREAKLNAEAILKENKEREKYNKKRIDPYYYRYEKDELGYIVKSYRKCEGCNEEYLDPNKNRPTCASVFNASYNMPNIEGQYPCFNLNGRGQAFKPKKMVWVKPPATYKMSIIHKKMITDAKKDTKQ